MQRFASVKLWKNWGNNMEFIIPLLLYAIAGLTAMVVLQGRAHKAYRAQMDAKINLLLAELRAAETKLIKGDDQFARYLRESG